MLVESARATLARACSTDQVRAMEADARGYDPDLWREMARLGWTGMLVPEDAGGSGQTFLEAALLLEEMGRVLLPSPFVPSCVLAPLLLMAVGDRRLLPGIAAGELVATVALVEPGWRDEWGRPTLESNGVLTGTKQFVPFAATADV